MSGGYREGFGRIYCVVAVGGHFVVVAAVVVVVAVAAADVVVAVVVVVVVVVVAAAAAAGSQHFLVGCRYWATRSISRVVLVAAVAAGLVSQVHRSRA